MAIVSSGLFFIDSISGEQIRQARAAVSTVSDSFMWVRWAFYIILYCYWKPLIRGIGRLKKWESEVIERAINSRNSSIIILIFIELLLILRIQQYLLV